MADHWALFIMTIVSGRSRIVCHASVESYAASWSIQGNRSFRRSYIFIYDYMTISHEFSNVSSCSKRYRLWQSYAIFSSMCDFSDAGHPSNKSSQGIFRTRIAKQVGFLFLLGVETINESFADESKPKPHFREWISNAGNFDSRIFSLGTRVLTRTPASHTRAPRPQLLRIISTLSTPVSCDWADVTLLESDV